jgi:P-type Mg2+ transporter
MLILVGAIFVANVALGRPLLDSLLFSVALAVGLTPQLLPAIVSVSLSLGAREMAHAKVIVKRLSAIEDFGGMNVLCTDKTGTLTQGTVRLAAALGLDGKSSADVLEAGYLNALHHAGFANPIDSAILAAQHVATTETTRLGEVPYDFQRRRLSVLVAVGEQRMLLTKGAVDSVLAVSATAEDAEGNTLPIEAKWAAIQQQFAVLSAPGLPRALRRAEEMQLGHRPGAPGRRARPDVPGVSDVPRSAQGGRRPRPPRAGGARHFGTHGHWRQPSRGCPRRVGRTAIFAEVDPVQKERIVRALQRAGHDVGYLGDGINDAPALHAADVSISVDSAVDVAKDAASLVLLENDLGVLRTACGRAGGRSPTHSSTSSSRSAPTLGTWPAWPARRCCCRSCRCCRSRSC